MRELFDIDGEVEEAIARGNGVALETSVVAQGLPAPANLESARRCARAVREAGGVPAAIALLEGRIVIGASDAQLQRLADPSRRPAKAGVRDLAPLLASRRDAGTTVSATCALAELAGLRVFATGGIGGVHRRAPGAVDEPLDVSSDLTELARRRVCVVCAGPKAILDLPATAEALETLGVLVLGMGTGELPAFYSDSSGVMLEHSLSGPDEVARVLTLHWGALEQQSGVLVAVPPPAPLPRAEVEAAIAAALDEARARGLGGKETTPFLLSRVAQATGGRAQQANVALLEHNARVAGQIAAALAAQG
jgi:pseudouridine-5'-phosphate glycosidase